MARPSPRLVDFTQRVLIVAAVATGLLAAWRLRYVFLLLFLAGLISLFVRSISDPVAERTGLPERVSVVATALGLAALVAALLAFFGYRLQLEIADLITSLPKAWLSAKARIATTALGSWFVGQIEAIPDTVDLNSFLSLRSYVASLTAAGANAILIFVAAIYLALEPRLYWRGVLKLVPRRYRVKSHDLASGVALALKAWLRAQMVAMISVGTLTAIGLSVIGVPAALALGVFAALAEFIPLIGPIVAAAPAILLAATSGLATAGWTAALFVAIQQMEGNLLLPLLQRRMVELPPVVTVFALMGFGVLFGPLGLLLATPASAVAVVVLRQLWKEEARDARSCA